MSDGGNYNERYCQICTSYQQKKLCLLDTSNFICGHCSFFFSTLPNCQSPMLAGVFLVFRSSSILPAHLFLWWSHFVLPLESPSYCFLIGDIAAAFWNHVAKPGFPLKPTLQCRPATLTMTLWATGKHFPCKDACQQLLSTHMILIMSQWKKLNKLVMLH